jgi:hypothetical protein
MDIKDIRCQDLACTGLATGSYGELLYINESYGYVFDLPAALYHLLKNDSTFEGTVPILFQTVDELYALADEIVGPLKTLRRRQHHCGGT